MKYNCFCSDKLINIAAQYWINIIRDGKEHDNGDYSATSLLCSHLANESTTNLENEKLEKFRKAFFEEFKKVAEEFQIHNEISLYCDYGPGLVLRQAAEKSGIGEIQFPWKTGIWVGTDYICENKPYARKKFKDSLIYCEQSYIKRLIEKELKDIDEIPKIDYLSEEFKKEYREECNQNLKVYEELLKELPEVYIREDLQQSLTKEELL